MATFDISDPRAFAEGSRRIADRVMHTRPVEERARG